MAVLFAAGVGAHVGLYRPAGAWAVLAAWVAFVAFLVCSPVARERGRSARGLCTKCGYDLTANVSGVCPECGTPVPPDRAAGNNPANDPRTPFARGLVRFLSTSVPFAASAALLYYGVRLARQLAQWF